MKSTVYFSNVSPESKEDRTVALKRLLLSLDDFFTIRTGEVVPIKLTIGDAACTHHLGPELIETIVTFLRDKKANPFLFDTNVIYTGSRQNTVSHLNLAEKKGFVQSKIGAPFVIADGIFGTDGMEYSVKNAQYQKKIKVPSFIGFLDNLIVVTHITGHILSGYGGAIKNVAMGMVSRPTKQVLHSSIKPYVREPKCAGCSLCVPVCPVKAISMDGGKAGIDGRTCIGCGECLCACAFNAISVSWKTDPSVFCYRMVEAASCVLSKFKKVLFINFAVDITKDCDCISKADGAPILHSDVGIFASSDIVSVEKAALDSVNTKEDIFAEAWKTDVHRKMLEYAGTFGLGNLDYTITSV